MLQQELQDVAPTSVRTFGTIEEARWSARAYAQELSERAKNNAAARDQDYPIEVLKYRPRQILSAPVLLIGGMGPLAGVQAFQRALIRAEHAPDREIVLLQLSNIPDRTEALMADRAVGHESELHRKVVRRLAAGLLVALREADRGTGPAPFIVACNTAHNFIPEALELIRTQAPEDAGRLRLISLIDSVISHLRRTDAVPLACYTEGTRASGIYAERFRREGLAYVEPDLASQAALTRAIYDGVKAFRSDVAAREGERFLLGVLDGPSAHFNAILAGCTEIPEVLACLARTSQDPRVQRVLRLSTIDPVALALESAFPRSRPRSKAA